MSAIAADVVFLPRDLEPHHIERRTIVVFDVLRATTSMAAALAAGVKEIQVFPDVDSARTAASGTPGNRLLCGEVDCLPPAGFDLGNSPGAFSTALHADRAMLMSTTNGTRALLAARDASAVFAGALVNAQAVAHAVLASLTPQHAGITLLCAGTKGEIAMEDVLGAGAVLREMLNKPDTRITLASDRAQIALRLFDASKDHLPDALAHTVGGQNVISAGLADDIPFCAQLNTINTVGVVRRSDNFSATNGLTVIRWQN